MTKTLDDYLNDPDLAHEPAALREVHAIRLMIQDETKNMTVSERTAYYNGNAETPSFLHEPLVIEPADAEETAMIKEGMEEYEKDPSTFTPWKTVKMEYR